MMERNYIWIIVPKMVDKSQLIGNNLDHRSNRMKIDIQVNNLELSQQSIHREFIIDQ